MPKIVEINGKKVRVYDPTNPEDLKLANEIAKEYEKQVNVEENHKSEREIEKKLDSAEIGKELFEDMMSKLRDAYTLEGLAVPKIETKEDLQNAVQNLEQFQNRGKRDAPAGTAPLNRAQITGGVDSEGFYSQEELIEHLREESRSGNREAQKILDQMFLKTLKGMKESERGVKTYEPSAEGETEIQRLNRRWRERQLKRRGINELQEG
jgi:hypothetical protein